MESLGPAATKADYDKFDRMITYIERILIRII